MSSQFIPSNLVGVLRQKFIKPCDVFHKTLESIKTPFEIIFAGENGAYNELRRTGLLSREVVGMKLWEVKFNIREPTNDERADLWFYTENAPVSIAKVSLTRKGIKALNVLNSGYVFNVEMNKPAEFRRTMNHYINMFESGKVPNEMFSIIETFSAPELAVVKSAATWYRLQGIVEKDYTVNPGFKWKRPVKVKKVANSINS